MGLFFFRTLLLLFVVIILLFSIPATRRRIIDMFRKKEWQAMKQNLVIALAIYFIFSVIYTIYEYA